MDSIALHQFPAVVWTEGEKRLWNPIHRKALKNRPEERVRLRIIEYLLEAGWSRHRISTEEAIRDYNEQDLRTDIICYNQAFEPKILIECKAENITLSPQTAQQIARYNRNVEAPVILLTNGLEDLWYRLDSDATKVQPMPSPPDILNDIEAGSREFGYWKERGFAGTKAVPDLRKWLKPLLDTFRSGERPLRYLQFNRSPTDLDLSHYYRIHPAGDARIALSVLGTIHGGTRLIAILNRDGENRAVAEINLDLVFENERPNTSVYSAKGVRTLDMSSLKDHDHGSLIPELRQLFGPEDAG